VSTSRLMRGSDARRHNGVPEVSVGHGREPGADRGTGRYRDGGRHGVGARQRKTGMEVETPLLRKRRHKMTDGLGNRSGDGERFEATAESNKQSAVHPVRQ